MVSIGLEIITIVALGEYLSELETTSFTIEAFVPISSSLVIPGLRGIPEVITITSEFEVAS
ncbi:hypothetical protein SDC9_166513 [bioreactor metagenome]|uniref:Uncharacterized protein n=1 Tax=bioreactor metagenome TaxID=1076179 RepID=A0A645FXA4_9ZZZZ